MIANERQIRVGGQELPGSGALIKALLAEGGGSPALERLGATAWWFQSGGSHAVNFALIESIEANEEATSPLGPQLASIFTSSRSVGLRGIIFGLGYRSMIEEHRRLFGWSNEGWDRAVQALMTEFERVTRASGIGS